MEKKSLVGQVDWGRDLPSGTDVPGMPITVQQMMALVKYMEGSLPSKRPSRKAMEELLMKSVFQPEYVHSAQEEFKKDAAEEGRRGQI